MPVPTNVLKEILLQELVQLREEGRDPGKLAEDVGDCDEESLTPERFESLYAELTSSPVRSEYPYVEPSDLAGIRAERPNGPRTLSLSLDEDELYDRLYGAWLGRCAGCMLGKPVEGWPRARIDRYLKTAAAYPLHDYFPVLDPFPEGLELNKSWPETALGHIRYMARDDDTDYTVLGLSVLEDYGLEFSTDDVAEQWLSRLPYHRVYTAERVAYRNLVNGFDPPHTANHHNPYREWIGALIRADTWGYVAIGRPELAAELAFRDAVLSHTKNGIYGEMLVAGMLAAAPVTGDVAETIHLGLTEIPKSCRLAQAVQDVLETHASCSDWDVAWNSLMAEYGGYHRVHTINNAIIVLLGLLYGDGDFGKTICLAVMGGHDTDCNGATAGSIAGMILGANGLPDKWTGPLNDSLKSAVMGFDDTRISDLARRTVAQSLP